MLSLRRFFLLIYAASGAAALVYEIAWTRLLTLQMGHTVAAASTVLAAFMGGLALGSWLGGRFDAVLQRRSSRPAVARLRAYATFEVTIGVAAVALPALLATFVPLLSWAYRDGLTPVTFSVVRVVLAAALLVVPATAMGATFPIAVGWYAGGAADAGRLYAANTAGAAIGALAAGFWLIPSIGLRATTWLGVALNVAAAAGALWLGSRPSTSEHEARGRDVNRADAQPADLKGPPCTDSRSAGLSGPRTAGRAALRAKRHPQGRSAPASIAASLPMPRVATAAAAISGCVALVYEIAWTRLLVLVIGPTTYAFTIVVASFILGLALGAAAGARVVRGSPQPAAWLGAMLAVTALGASTTAWFAASRLPLIVAAQVANPEAAFAGTVTRQALVIAVLLLPMTCALGAAFPLALAARAGSADIADRADRHVIAAGAARVYAWNTLGAIVGSLSGGFALLPALGLQNTFRAAAAVAVLAALGVWIAAAQSPARPRVAAMASAFAVAVAIIVLLPRWDQRLLASGAYKYAPYIRLDDLETELRVWKLLYYADGAAATVAVREFAGMRSLSIDGKVDASNMGDMLTQRLLGLLPVLLHRDAQEICVIGLGSGVTAASALAPGTIRQADVVEISPEVVKASSFFERENGGVRGAPGVRLIVGDGRSHLLLTSRRYDVIVSEPSNVWMAGIAALFTREFFEAARARLKPDGIICQWAHTYDMQPDDLQSIVRTFASVFPEATMWLVGEGDLLLIGASRRAIDLAGLSERVARGNTAALLADVAVPRDVAPFALLSMFAGGPAELTRYAGNAPIQDDDRMALEFSAPRAIYGRMTGENAAAIRALAANAHVPLVRAAVERASDASWAAAGAMELKADAYSIAYENFQRAVRLNSRNAAALSGLSDAAVGARRHEEARAFLQSVANAEPGNASVRIELSRLSAMTGNIDQAVAAAEEAMRLTPDDPQAGEQLASVLADAGDAARLGAFAERLMARFPERDQPRFYRATALFLAGRTQEAIAEARRLLAADPKNGRTQNLLGVACATAGQSACAISAFEAARAVNPRDPATHVNLGVYRLQSGDPAAAIEAFSTAMTLDRSSAAARQGLADARAALAGR
jgi:spermidine synthase